ncbi:hypothetical protein GW17_00043942 [Ensete ventricosum]|nr:hypothetical protein GW17_00043942 [Ensete ventricosum]
MKKEGSSGTSFEAPCGRITRARAAACRANGKLPPLMPSVANTEKKQTRHSNLKRAAFDENSHGFHPAASQCKKKRAVLTDVTNMFSQNSSRNWLYDYPGVCSGLDFIDIDTDHGNPQMCCTYASEFYTNLCAAEVFPNMLLAPV